MHGDNERVCTSADLPVVRITVGGDGGTQDGGARIGPRLCVMLSNKHIYRSSKSAGAPCS